ncbi:hypothetical protein F5887DRAFT_410099 [Amanita rubescens]|nr:hypothetical protein F5887DRAFT_410099 [Amanita rubescens]
MFNSLRQVVESLPATPGADNGSRSSTPLSSSQSSLRKSLAAQRGRSASPAPRSSSTGKKLSLEDRLKASLATGDANNSRQATPSTSDNQKAISSRPDSPSNASLVPPPVSPRLIPLPGSPPLSPVLEKSLKDTLVQANNVTQNHAREPGDITQTSESETNLNAAHGSANQDSSTDIESLQERLKQVEQRFLDVSESFKTLQANKVTVDEIFRELTPLQTIDDTVALGDYLRSIISKPSVWQFIVFSVVFSRMLSPVESK